MASEKDQGPNGSAVPPGSPPPPAGTAPPSEETPESLHPGLKDYAEKICPILTLAGAVNTTNKDRGVDGQACVGPACALFVQQGEIDEKGNVRVIGGGCSIQVGVRNSTAIGNLLADFLQKLQNRVKIHG